MKDEKLTKSAETKKQVGCRKPEWPQPRWKDCMKGYIGKAEEDEKWREKGNNMEQWKQLNKSSHTVECRMTSLTFTKGN